MRGARMEAKTVLGACPDSPGTQAACLGQVDAYQRVTSRRSTPNASGAASMDDPCRLERWLASAPLCESGRMGRNVLHVVLGLLVATFLVFFLNPAWFDRLPAWAQPVMGGLVLAVALADVAAFASPRFQAWLTGKARSERP
jgi:hypothetical protein